MRVIGPGTGGESFDEWRERMLAETSAFIEWGLKHPEEVTWIPKHPVGGGSFSERMKGVFWGMIAGDGEH